MICLKNFYEVGFLLNLSVDNACDSIGNYPKEFKLNSKHRKCLIIKSFTLLGCSYEGLVYIKIVQT
jgi:hypothetical protein